MKDITGQRLVVRADGSPRVGTGHVMRSLALAQAWQDAGGRVTFLTGGELPALDERLRSEGMDVVALSVEPAGPDDAARTAEQARRDRARWVVVDGYRFGADYLEALASDGPRLLLVDDTGRLEHYGADVVLNQNLHASADLYGSRAASTRLLLGTDYVLLRREFRAWRDWRREVPELARRALVSLGGADPGNVTLKVLRAVREAAIEPLEAVVVVGGANPHYDELRAAAREPGSTVRLERGVTDMTGLLAEADVAICSGGITVWELGFMGCPALIGITTPIEETLVGGLREHGLFDVVGRFAELSRSDLTGRLEALAKDPGARREMARLARQTVDGLGCERALEAMMGEETA